jgi:hypothetical protein
LDFLIVAGEKVAVNRKFYLIGRSVKVGRRQWLLPPGVPRLGDVLPQLCDQVVGPLEWSRIAQPFMEVHHQRLAVQIALEVDQVNFDLAGVFAERRVRPDVGRAWPHFLSEIDLTPTIAEFSELGDFMDTPVRSYLAGMMVRLALAISTSIEPEVLLIDEVLSLGDSGSGKSTLP